MVLQLQMEEYEQALKEEQKSHERTKSNEQSLSLQLQNMHQALKTKQQEVKSVITFVHFA